MENVRSFRRTKRGLQWWTSVRRPGGRPNHTLEHLNQQLQSDVRIFPTERLSQELGSEYPAYVQFCGTPQHDLYHAGQIVLLKKALSALRRAV